MRRTMIVPAAGRGSRLGTSLPKVLVPVNGRPMLDHILDLHAPFADRFVVVVAPAFESDVREQVRNRPNVSLELQHLPTGMLDAILAAREAIRAYPPDEVWITWCDQIAVERATVERMTATLSSEPKPSFVFPTVTAESPYIHYARNSDGCIDRVLQRREGDAMPEIGEGDIGLFAMTGSTYLDALEEFSQSMPPAGTGTKERNFLPFIPWLAQRASVLTLPATARVEAIGVNTPEELEFVSRHLRKERS